VSSLLTVRVDRVPRSADDGRAPGVAEAALRDGVELWHAPPTAGTRSRGTVERSHTEFTGLQNCPGPRR
jgi:hypothetical protein